MRTHLIFNYVILGIVVSRVRALEECGVDHVKLLLLYGACLEVYKDDLYLVDSS